MSIFIKTGFWKKFKDNKAPEGWFNLGNYILDFISKIPTYIGIESVTGNLVDNTDPKNPTVNLPYKKYVGLISQTGTSDPVLRTLENTLTELPSFERVEAGWYQCPIAESTPETTMVFIGTPNEFSDSYYLNVKIFAWYSSQNVIINTKYADNDSDLCMINIPIEIRIYQ